MHSRFQIAAAANSLDLQPQPCSRLPPRSCFAGQNTPCVREKTQVTPSLPLTPVGPANQIRAHIGQPVAPIAGPSAASETQTRAVRIPPANVRRLTPLDLNIVYQRPNLSSQQLFDLIIGTNISSTMTLSKNP